MAKITIAAHDHAAFYERTPAFARICYQQPFVNDDGDSVAAGDVTGAYFVQVAVTYSGGITTIPSFTGSTALDSTIVSSTGRVLSMCSLSLHDASGAFIDFVFQNIRIPATPTSTTWASLKLISEMTRSSFKADYASQEQMQRYVEYAIAAFPRSFSQLSDVTFSGVANGDIPVYSSVTGDWENEPFATTADSVAHENWCVEIETTKSSNVNHGLVHIPATTYGKCWFEAWIKPTGSGYIYSSGYGGAHTLLFGTSGDATLGYTLTGNFYNTDTSVNVSFATSERVRHNEWCYVAVCYDQTRITVIINGIVSAIVAYTGDRYVGATTDAVGFVGGSDHQNFDGRIMGWRLFEGSVPLSNAYNAVFRPPLENFRRSKVWDGTGLIAARAHADYRRRSAFDISGNGYHGFFNESTNQGNTLTGEGGQFVLPAGENRVPANAPTWVVDPFAWPTTGASPATPTVGAVIFDSFGRKDVHFGNYDYGTTVNYALNLGTTEVGNKTWVATNYGINNGLCYPTITTPGVANVTDSQVNREIRLVKPDTGFVTGYGLGYRVVFNYTDANNYNFVEVDEYGAARVWEKVAGVLTQAGSNLAFGTGWITLKVIITSGTSVAVYKDATLIGSRTVAANLSATSKGFELNHPVQRIDRFEVL